MSEETISAEEGQQIVSRAKEFLPVGDNSKYKYETGEKKELGLLAKLTGALPGIDCTGLVHKAITNAGIKVEEMSTATMNSTDGWRKSYVQIKDAKDVRAGDVIVFLKAKRKDGTIENSAHAGIVKSIDHAQNKGRFIHSDTYDNTKEYEDAKKDKTKPRPSKKYFTGPKEQGFVADLSVKSGFPSLKRGDNQTYDQDFYGGYGRWVSKFLRPKKVVKETEKSKEKKSSSSKTPQVITKDAARAISFFPDVCWTQIGPSSVPIPYIIVGYTSDSVNVCQQVTFNGKPVLLCKQSYISKVFGDEAGSNGGIKSGTVSGEVVPKEGSTIFTVNGNEIVCHGDKCTMNGGNTYGEFNSFNMSPGCGVSANGNVTSNTNPSRESNQCTTSSDQNQSQSTQTQKASPTGNHGGGNAGQGSAAASQEPPKQDVPYEYKRDNRRDPFEPLTKDNNQSVAKTALP